MTLKTTDKLVIGDVVATSKVGVEAVTRAAPGARGAWRTIEGHQVGRRQQLVAPHPHHHVHGRHECRGREGLVLAIEGGVTMSGVTMCSNEHEKPVPAAESHPVDGKQQPFCQACSEVWKQQQREAT